MVESAPFPEAILAEKQHQRRSTRLAILLFASLTAHNIPEGFAVAVSAISGVACLRWACSATITAMICIVARPPSKLDLMC